MRYYTYISGEQVGAQTNRDIAIRDALRLMRFLQPGLTVRVYDLHTSKTIFIETT